MFDLIQSGVWFLTLSQFGGLLLCLGATIGVAAAAWKKRLNQYVLIFFSVVLTLGVLVMLDVIG